jgi:hypothetical protein
VAAEEAGHGAGDAWKATLQVGARIEREESLDIDRADVALPALFGLQA